MTNEVKTIELLESESINSGKFGIKCSIQARRSQIRFKLASQNIARINFWEE